MLLESERIHDYPYDPGVVFNEPDRPRRADHRRRCHNLRVSDILLLYGFILAKEPSMRRFDAKEPPKPRGTPPSSRGATPSWPPYLRGHPAQRLISDEEILRLYVEEKLDGGTIGYRAGCSGRTVLEIVRSLGGVVRGRGVSRCRQFSPAWEGKIPHP
jgi:hypothetical protein